MIESEKSKTRKMNKAHLREAVFNRKLIIVITLLAVFVGQQTSSPASENNPEFLIKKYVLENWFFDSEKSKKDTICLRDLNNAGEPKRLNQASRSEIQEKLLTYFRADGVDIHDREKCYMVDFEMFSPEGRSAMEISIGISPTKKSALYNVNTGIWFDVLGCGMHSHEVSFKNGLIRIEKSELLKMC